MKKLLIIILPLIVGFFIYKGVSFISTKTSNQITYQSKNDLYATVVYRGKSYKIFPKASYEIGGIDIQFRDGVLFFDDRPIESLGNYKL